MQIEPPRKEDKRNNDKEHGNDLTSRYMPATSLNKRQEPGSNNSKERRRIREFRGESNLKND